MSLPGAHRVSDRLLSLGSTGCDSGTLERRSGLSPRKLTLPPVTIDRIEQKVLADGLDDWVGLWQVVRYVREGTELQAPSAVVRPPSRDWSGQGTHHDSRLPNGTRSQEESERRWQPGSRRSWSPQWPLLRVVRALQ